MILSSREQFIVLTDHDRLEKADVIVLLEGDKEARVPHACRLLKDGWAPRLIFSGGLRSHKNGSYPIEDIAMSFHMQGIDINSLIIEEKSLQTNEQAINIINLCENEQWNSIILVASHYHQYRAFLTFLQVLQNRKLERTIEIINSAATRLNWFEVLEYGVRFQLLETEFEKIEYYKEKQHVAQFEDAIKYYKWRWSLKN